MTYFAGLDVSLEETAICVVDEAGGIVKELRAASEPEALVAALRTIGLPLARIGLEACSLTAWLHEGLTQAGLPAICIETRQANVTVDNNTTYAKRASATSASIAQGKCLAARGTDDASGALQASTVTVAPTENGMCRGARP